MTTTRRWWVFALVSLALFMGALDSLVVTTALPVIERALHARISDLEWTVNAYALVFTICMIPAAALGVGPLVGGAVVSGWSWNAVFWMNVPLGVILLVLGRLHLPESRSDQQSLDIAGSVLIGASLLAIIFGITSGNTAGWSSVPVLGTLAVGVLLLLAFLRREQRAAVPMIELKLFMVRSFSIANGIGFLMNLGTVGSIFFITQFMQNVLKASPFVAGLETMPWTGTIMLVAPLTGWLTKRLGTRPVVLAGMLAQAVALAWIGALATGTVSYVRLLPAFVLAGAGMGLALAPLTNTVMGAIAGPQQGQASSVLNTLRQLGGGQFLDGFRVAIFAGASVLTTGGLLALLLPGREVFMLVSEEEPILADATMVPVG